jgi:hypothetical protein
MQSVTAPAPVLDLAFDGGRVAYATGRSARDCNRVYVWSLATNAVSRLGRKTHCEETSTGNSIAQIAVAGTRVLWLHYAGGNFREWSLWTATTTRPSPIRLRLVTSEADASAPIVIGGGDSGRLGDILPYAVGRTVIALRANGGRRFAWSAPARVVALSALEGELAVATEGGEVTVLDAAGRVLGTESYAGEIHAVKITGNGLLVQRGRTLELRDAGSPRLWTLPSGARLEDAADARAYYVAREKVHAQSLAGAQTRIVANGRHGAVEGLTIAVAQGRLVRTLRRTF